MCYCAVDIPGEGYTFDIDQVEIAATNDGENMAFIGHMQNFFIDRVDVIALLQRHASAVNYSLPLDDSAPAHSVRSNTGQLTDREIPIPVNPVTLRAGPGNMEYLRLKTLDLSHGNATLKMMFKTRVSSTADGWRVYLGGVWFVCVTIISENTGDRGLFTIGSL